MRQCSKKGCGIVLKDDETACPVCGTPTVSLGDQGLKKPHYADNELRAPILRRRQGSCVGNLVLIIIAVVIMAWVWKKVMAPTPPSPTGNTALGTALIDRLTQEPPKKN